MSRKIHDLTGRRFGRLTVLELLPERKNGCPVWLCRCDCGQTKAVARANLVSGGTRSCGCLRREAMSENRGRGKAPYPANEDCANYNAEAGECHALTELQCAAKGRCGFFRPRETP